MRAYFDHASTTPLCPESLQALTPWLAQAINPSSLHSAGRKGKEALDKARLKLSETLGCLFGEVIFTSSGTEAASLALIGTARKNFGSKRNKILLSAAEHHCVLHQAPFLRQLGYEVIHVPVNRYAQVDPEVLCGLIDERTLLVSVMQANNEFGTLQDISKLTSITKPLGVLFHTDAVQRFPVQCQVDDLGVDLYSLSGHKIYGPKGVGALYVRSGTPIEGVILGGGQERDMRSGTENLAGIVGLDVAIQAGLSRMELEPKIEKLRDRFASAMVSLGFVPTLPLFDSIPCLPGHFHCRWPGIGADVWLIRLDRAGIAASSGAACSSGSLEPSHVLKAAGYSESEAREGLRFSFGYQNTEDEVEWALEQIKQILDSIQAKKC